jgi:hypothetical protein
MAGNGASSGQRLGGVFHAVGRPDGVAEANALRLEAIQQPTRPNELRGENREPQRDGQPAGPGRDQHHHANQQQCEPDQDLEETFGLLNRSEEHETRAPGLWQLSLWKGGQLFPRTL